ncbi:MAG: hypothetical protein EOM66_04935 [Clostridia bacterium]|nr:hypothetical protein [Clostridia bacterium]
MDAIDYDAMVYPCRGLALECGNHGETGPRNANLCTVCANVTRDTAAWMQRNDGWGKPLHLASVDVSLRALATMHSNTGLVCDFFNVLEDALLAQQSFNGFAGISRFMHALAVSAPHIIGGILTDEDWASMRRCSNWCGHAPHVACVKPCNAAMRGMVRMFASGGICALSVASGIVATIANHSAKRKGSREIICDIISLAPEHYALWMERKLRASYGVRPRISDWVMSAIKAKYAQPAVVITAQQTAVEGRA